MTVDTSVGVVEAPPGGETVRVRAGVTAQQFEDAKNKLSALKNDPGNEVKLKIYALFKQVMINMSIR